jgi:hypothetical protein
VVDQKIYLDIFAFLRDLETRWRAPVGNFCEREEIELQTKKAPIISRAFYVIQNLFHGLNEFGKLFWVFVCHFGENLAVDLNFLVGHFGDESAILLSMHSKSGVEAQDPQAAESSFPYPAVAIGIFASLEERFLGGTIGGFAMPHIPFGGFQNFFSSFGGGCSAFDS